MILKDKSYSSKYPAPSPSIPYCTYARADKGKSSKFHQGKTWLYFQHQGKQNGSVPRAARINRNCER